MTSPPSIQSCPKNEPDWDVSGFTSQGEESALTPGPRGWERNMVPSERGGARWAVLLSHLEQAALKAAPEVVKSNLQHYWIHSRNLSQGPRVQESENLPCGCLVHPRPSWGFSAGTDSPLGSAGWWPQGLPGSGLLPVGCGGVGWMIAGKGGGSLDSGE